MQNIDRRQMLTLTAKGATAATLIGSVSLVESCNALQWIQTALADLPTILQIVTSILSIISAAGGGVPASTAQQVASIGAEVKTDLETAQSLVTAYQTAASTAKPGILSKLDIALGTALDGLQSILTAFHVADPTLQATISASLGAAITIVLAIEALVPPPPVAPVARVALGNPKDQSAAMKTAYNSIVGKNYPNAIVK